MPSSICNSLFQSVTLKLLAAGHTEAKAYVRNYLRFNKFMHQISVDLVELEDHKLSKIFLSLIKS